MEMRSVRLDVNLPKAWSEAKRLGIKHYFTGIPCKRGHISKRIVSKKACLECCLIQTARWRADNPEKARIAYAKSNSTEKRKTYNKARKRSEAEKTKRALAYQRNKKKAAMQVKKWRANNKERHIATRKEWQKNNKLSLRTYCLNRRARLKNASGTHTKDEVLALYVSQQERCACCVMLLDNIYHVDHKTPLSRGGGNDISNLQILCPKCNLEKSDKDYILWLAEVKASKY